jgi:hypothetical protein
MNQENNNQVLPSFYFSIKEYLHIFDINSLLTLNNFINTRLNSTIAKITVYRIFIYGMYEFQKSVINSPEITLNIIQKVLVFLRQNNNKEKIDKIYKMILNAKNLSDFEKIQDFIEK